MSKYSIYSRELYLQPTWSRIEACYSKTWRNFAMQPHAHQRAEVMYVLKGGCRVFYQDGEEERELRMGAGDFVFIDGGTAHRLYAGDKQTGYLLNVEMSFEPSPGVPFVLSALRSACEDFKAFLCQRRPVVCGRDERGDLFKSFNFLLECHLRQMSDPMERCRTDAAMLSFLMQLSGALASSRQGVGGMVHIRRAQDYIQSHYDRPLKLAQIADKVGVHPSYLEKLFKRVLDCTPTEYMTRVRVSRAAFLLNNTDRPVIDLALECGFTSRQHFARCFTRLMGIAPAAYRAKTTVPEAREIFLFEEADSESI